MSVCPPPASLGQGCSRHIYGCDFSRYVAIRSDTWRCVATRGTNAVCWRPRVPVCARAARPTGDKHRQTRQWLRRGATRSQWLRGGSSLLCFASCLGWRLPQRIRPFTYRPLAAAMRGDAWRWGWRHVAILWRWVAMGGDGWRRVVMVLGRFPDAENGDTAIRRAMWRYVALLRAACPLRVYYTSARGLPACTTTMYVHVKCTVRYEGFHLFSSDPRSGVFVNCSAFLTAGSRRPIWTLYL